MMSPRPPSRKGRLLLACALLEISGGSAAADTGATGYGGPGNVFNPQGQNLTLLRDPQGLSQLDDITRTPTGLLYPTPFQQPEMTQSKDNPDWWTSGWVQAGVAGTFGADTRSAQFHQYGDWKSGPLATSLGFQAENRKSALYVSAVAENAGRSDQYYQLKVGRYGEFNVTSFFDSVPHAYSTTAKPIWDGVGSGNLTLKSGLTPGASTVAQVNAAAAAAPLTTLRVTREKAGSSLVYTPYQDLELFVQLSDEWREGAQPISATFGYPFENGATQIAQPVHYQTFDVTTAIRFKEDNLQADLTYAGSFFRNGTSSLTWQNPGLYSPGNPSPFIPTLGRLSLPPDNDYHTFKGDLTAVLSPDTRFSASLSYSLMRQNEQLLPPTADSGIIAGPGISINLDQWNTVAALSQPSAHAAIDIFNAFAQLHYTVSPTVNLTFELRDRNEDNRTNYLALNPQNGQYGYIAVDGGLAAFNPKLSGLYRPNLPGSLTQIRNMPFANDNLKLSADADWRMDSHMKLNLSYANNSIHHSIREVPDADDNIVRLQFDTMGYEWGTVRASYQFARRTGSDYDSNPYTSYYSSSLTGYLPATPAGDPPFALTDLRKFDMANRSEHTLHLQSNYVLTRRTDLQFSGNVKIEDYDAAYGLRSTTALDATGSFNYQMSPLTSFTGFFTFQVQDRGVANINPTGAGTSGAAGSPAYPLANAWHQTAGSDNYTAGLNVRHSWDKVQLSADYTFSYADSPLNYTYASTSAFFKSFTAAQAGNSFPATTFRSHALETNLLWQAEKNLSYRLYYRISYQNLADFHYSGLTAGVINNNTYLGVVPENYTAQTVGLFIQYQL